jgi:Skp family chaperone for outer membrane proteins
MRHSKLVIPFLLAAALPAGCKATAEKSPAATKQDETAALQLGKAKSATKEAAQAMEDYAYARKAEFVANMNKELVAIQEELDRLAAKIDSAGDAAKADAKTKIETMREQWSKTNKLLDQTESATESTWDKVKGDYKQSYAGLKDSIETTRQWLSDKIAP